MIVGGGGLGEGRGGRGGRGGEGREGVRRWGGWEKGEGKIGVVCRYGPDGFCLAVAIAVGKEGSGDGAAVGP